MIKTRKLRAPSDARLIEATIIRDGSTLRFRTTPPEDEAITYSARLVMFHSGASRVIATWTADELETEAGMQAVLKAGALGDSFALVVSAIVNSECELLLHVENGYSRTHRVRLIPRQNGPDEAQLVISPR
jgi:hypothetical protein